ncbi:MAG: hypothetical protein U0269_13725 [Polyangiales bacterium]
MSDLRVNGVAVLRGDLLLPRVGPWSADLLLDSDEALTGRATIESPAGFRLVGHCERSQTVAGRVEVRLRGGDGGLGRVLEPVAYRPIGGVRLRAILEDWARDSGERISAQIDHELTERFIDGWVRERGSAARAIRALALSLGCSWRFDEDGALMLVRESWPEVDPDGVQVLRDDPLNDASELAVEVLLPELVPGVTWQGRRVSSVEAFVLESGANRVRLLYENESSTLGRDRAAEKYNVTAREEIDAAVFARTFLGRVVAQSADLATVDVELEPNTPREQRVLPQLIRVPIYASIPGQVVELELSRGVQFCALTFLDAERRRPVVVGWEGSARDNSGKTARVSRLRGARIDLGDESLKAVARERDPVRAAPAMQDWMTEVSARLTAMSGASPVEPPLSSIGYISSGSQSVRVE